MSSRARGRQPQPLASSGTPSKEIGKRDLLAWAATVSGQRIETTDDLRDGVVLALIFTDTFPAVVGREQVLSRALTLTLILTLPPSLPPSLPPYLSLSPSLSVHRRVSGGRGEQVRLKSFDRHENWEVIQSAMKALRLPAMCIDKAGIEVGRFKVLSLVLSASLSLSV